MLPDIETERRALALFRRLLEAGPVDEANLDAELADCDAELAARVRAMLDSHRSATSRIERSWQPAQSAPPSRLGPYALTRELGRGGMGVVMLGERDIAGIAQRVAIKLIQGGQLDSERRLRFALEREVVARLRHPHIAQLLDGGEGPDGELWYAMELVEGATLATHCDQGRIGLRERVGLLVDLCEAVGHAHRHSILHRDIKPSNVLVTAEGQLKLIDFGIAKTLGDDQGDLTIDSRPMTPRYAAPEQLRGERPTTASDLWQLGALAFELLVGQPLREDGQGLSTMPSQRARTGGEATAALRGLTPPQLALTLQGDLDAIVMKALRPESAARYASADEMAADLRAWLSGQPVAARRGERGYALRRLIGAHRWAVGFAVLALLAVVGGGVTSFVLAQRAREEARIAQSTSDLLSSMLLSTHNAPNLASMQLRDFFAHVVDTALADTQLPASQRYELLYDLSPRAREAGAAEAAERAARGMLATAPAAAGERSLQTAVAHDYVASAAMHARGHVAIDEAAEHLRSAEALYAALNLRDNPEYLTAHLRASIRLEHLRGDYPAMLRVAREAVAVAKQHRPGLRLNFHPMLLTALAANGDWKSAAAEADWMVAQTQAEAATAPDIANMLDWLRSKACLMRAHADPGTALPLCDELIGRLEREDRMDTRIGRDALLGRAVAQAAGGGHEAALASVQAAGRSLDAVEGADSKGPDRLEIDRLRGRELYLLGRHAEASALQQAVLEAQRDRLGAEHPETLQLRIELLESLRAAGKPIDDALMQVTADGRQRLSRDWLTRWDAVRGKSDGITR